MFQKMFTGIQYGCMSVTFGLTLRKERGLMSKNRMLRKIYGPRRVRVRGDGRNCIMRSIMIATAQQML
jgi:hypothetical protein